MICTNYVQKYAYVQIMYKNMHMYKLCTKICICINYVQKYAYVQIMYKNIHMHIASVRLFFTQIGAVIGNFSQNSPQITNELFSGDRVLL